jgi:hypothetical protein
MLSTNTKDFCEKNGSSLYNSPDFERNKKLKITRFLQNVPASSQKNKNDVNFFKKFIPDL